MKKTVKGIHLDIDPAVFSDILTLEILADTMTPLPDDVSKAKRSELEAERIRAIFKLSRRIFGDKFDSVYKQLAAKNGGYVSADEWSKFLSKVMDEYQKHDDARPAPSGK